MPDYNYGINTVNFIPSSYEGIKFTPQIADLNILANSLAVMEERERTANEKLSALNATIADIRGQLLNTDEFNEWVDEYSRNIINNVETYARYGDYANAINQAVRLAGQVLNDPALQGRVKFSTAAKEDLKKLEERIGKGVSRNTYEYAKNVLWNTNYEDFYDTNGNIIGGTEYTQMNVKDDIDVASLFTQAFNMVTPDRPEADNTSITTAEEYDNRSSSAMVANNRTQQPLSGYSQEVSEQRQRELKSEDDIYDSLEWLMLNNPDLISAAEQDYEVSKYFYNKAKTQLKDAQDLVAALQIKKLTGNWTDEDEQRLRQAEEDVDNNSEKIRYRNQLEFVDGNTNYKEWLIKKVLNHSVAKRLGYDYKKVSRATKDAWMSYNNTTARGGTTTVESNETPHASNQGVSVKQTTNFNNNQEQAQQAGNAAAAAVSGGTVITTNQ